MSDSSVVFVGCLHPSVTEGDLLELMSRVGAVEKVQIRRDDSGRSRCCGTVTFADTASAEKAILNFDDTRFRDRTLHVEAFKSRRPDAPKLEPPTTIKMSESDSPEPPTHRHSHHHSHHHHGHHRHRRRRDDRGDENPKETHRHHGHHHHRHHRHRHRRPAQYSSYSDESSDRSRKGKD
jgi:RNA recognition motif-containing protein